MSNYINLNSITSQIKIQKVEIPELGGHIFIKEMSGKVLNLVQSAKDDTATMATMLMHSLVNEDGSRVLPQVDDVTAFFDKVNVKVIAAINKAIQEVNNLEVVDAEEEAKN